MKREFAPLVWAFNLLPSSWCHAGWLPRGVDDTVLRERHAVANPCHRYLSPWLLDAHGLTGRFEFTFPDRFARIALIDAPALERMATLLGLLLRREALRRIVDGGQLASLRSAVGMAEIGFLGASAGAFALEVPDEMGRLPASGMGQTLQADGRQVLACLGRTCSGAVADRLQMKFQPAVDTDLPRFFSSDDADLAKAWIVEQLVPRMLPSWTPLFC
ncbi:SctK family type III secretion system sorting platform protein [Trinickia sp.]|uniref:SctK family type III secretion system sorting platform protein n=1 Tax=Trinickia sp. TaxID=2571163 RepID=UPI003F816975